MEGQYKLDCPLLFVNSFHYNDVNIKMFEFKQDAHIDAVIENAKTDVIENIFTKTISHLEMADSCVIQGFIACVGSLRCHWPVNYSKKYMLMIALGLRLVDNLDKG